MRTPSVVRSVAAACLAAVSLSAQEPKPEPKTVHQAAGFDIEVIGDLKGFALDVRTRRLAEGLEVLALRLTSPQPAGRRPSSPSSGACPPTTSRATG